MNVLDVALLLVWLGAALAGFWRGALKVVFGLAGAGFGIWLAATGGAETAALLQDHLGISWLSGLIAHALLFLMPLALALASAWGFERTLKALKLGWLNRLAGAALTGTLAALLLALLLTIAAGLSPTVHEAVASSIIAGTLLELAEWLLA